MSESQVITPVDGSVYLKVPLMDIHQLDQVCQRSRTAQKDWQAISLEKRIEQIEKTKELLPEFIEEIAESICWSMGRPLEHSRLVINPLRDRLQFAADNVAKAIASKKFTDQPQISRRIERVPHGIVFVIGPWNYPFLTVCNVIFPALLTGNSVILKHALQTHKTALVLEKLMRKAGFPKDLFQIISARHDTIAEMLGKRAVDFVSFTGSVRGGKEIERAIAGTFMSSNLELGGKDPAYVMEDCDIEKTAATIAEGSFYNSGQCCCAIERAYVRKEIYKPFIDALITETLKLKLDNPTKPETNLGPMVTKHQADQVRDAIREAITQGARPLIDSKSFPRDSGDDAYLAPQILADCNHTMNFMKEETFGPCLGIMEVSTDEEALHLMNDSSYGLTASIWTNDEQRANQLGRQVETGTLFMNRCDYLDPYLPWCGVKDTGRGCSLSIYGFDMLTKPKGYHLRNWN